MENKKQFAVKEWLGKIEKDKLWRWLIFLWLTLLPFLCCAAYCLKTGNSIRDMYLPAGLWNDDIIYFKEVEGIVKYGMPQGYFGYSDAHALVGSLSVWSPVLLVPWCIWGFLFGWNYMSPIWCNIVMMMAAMGVFALLNKPTGKQTFWLSAFYITFIRLTRYALSVHVETTVYFMIILILALVFYLRKKESRTAMGFLLFLTVMLTWMRPYYVVLLAIPAYALGRKNKKYLWGMLAVFLAAVGGYFLISKYLCAPYLDGEGLLDVSWLTTFFTDGFKAGVKNILHIFLYSVDEFMKYLGSAISNGSSMGENAGITFAMVFVCLVYKLVTAVRSGDQELRLRYGYWVVYYVLMFLAITYIFSISSGQKHLLGFGVIGLFLLAMDGMSEGKMWLVTFVLSYLFLMRTLDATSWNIPYLDVNVQGELQKGEAVLDEEIQVTTGGPSYDNTVIWVFDDVVNGEYVFTNWQMLYALPEGMGINMCLFDTLATDLSNVQSKYVFVAAGGRIDEHCQRIQAKKVVEYGNSIIYQLRD
ncbi:MAG: hypothetical protein HFI31_00600 [Lachnospiraceae bacterium]|nr:hypothetical protein [Lachnospiraceae bacterium]